MGIRCQRSVARRLSSRTNAPDGPGQGQGPLPRGIIKGGRRTTAESHPHQILQPSLHYPADVVEKITRLWFPTSNAWVLGKQDAGGIGGGERAGGRCEATADGARRRMTWSVRTPTTIIGLDHVWVLWALIAASAASGFTSYGRLAEMPPSHGQYHDKALGVSCLQLSVRGLTVADRG